MPVLILIIVLMLVTKNDRVGMVRIEIDCPTYCVCNWVESHLVLTCNESHLNTLFRLPSAMTSLMLQQQQQQQQPELSQAVVANTTRLTCAGSYLRTFPLNVCEYARTLESVDLSSNRLAENLNPSHVGCLVNLRLLNLSRNFISFVDANTFNSLTALEVLDLSHNRLTMIPTYLFYLKVPNLQSLYLSYNQLTEIDVWMLWMTSIHLIDLSHNDIVTFVNRIGWNPYYVTSNIKMAETSLVDLSSNRLHSLDDRTLSMFSVCTVREFQSFIELFKQFRLVNNPIECACEASYNLLKFYQAYAREHLIPTHFLNDRFVTTRCHSPSTYAGLSIFAFVNPVVCERTSTVFTSSNCGYLAASKANASDRHELDKSSQIANSTTSISNRLYTIQFVMFIVAMSLFILLALTLLYCICPIEILALVFNIVPYFHSICPCKRNHKKHSFYNQDNDLFISYNKSNERWVKNKLVPFIKNNCLVESLILHYGPDNRHKEVYGPYIKEVVSCSACILFVVSDQFLTNEWSSLEFRQHIQTCLAKNSSSSHRRFVCVQMSDVLDEQIQEYLVDVLRLPRLDVLINDEFMFWAKLAYFLFTNPPNEIKVMAPKIHVKPLTNKVHTSWPSKTDEKLLKKSKKSSSSSDSHSSTDNDKSSNIFEVSTSYRTSLPPLRVPRQLEESITRQYMNTLNRNFEDHLKPTSISINRSSIIDAALVSSSSSSSTSKKDKRAVAAATNIVSVEETQKRSAITSSKKRKGLLRQLAETATEALNETRLYENVPPIVTKSERMQQQRNVSFDIYDSSQNQNQNAKYNRRETFVFENSDFV